MGRGLGRPDLRLGLTEHVSMEIAAASVGDVGGSERDVGEIGGVLVVEDNSSVWRCASLTCCSNVPYKKKIKTRSDVDVLL